MRMVGLLGTLGFEIVAFMVVCIFLGRYLDARFNTEPVWLAIGIIGGLLLGLTSALFTLRTFIKDGSDE